MSDRAAILIVDDRPEKALSIEAVLEDLGQETVRAYSGREALRQVLQREFAVILLDVNMPDMDGFETASMIRQRKSSEHTPIIFVTAFGDEMHAARGYSLGAVDYILAPVMPDVLRTKVAVFVDLFRKSQQLRRQTEWLRERAAQLHKLTRASVAINAAMSIDDLLRVVADTARDVVGAHQARIHATIDFGRPTPLDVSSFSGKYAGYDGTCCREVEEAGMADLICRASKPLRLTGDEFERQLGGPPSIRLASRVPVMRGWLAAPLTGRDGRGMGLLQLTEKTEGEFTEDDLAILVQLAQMASIAIENTLFAQEREANRLKDEFLATLSHELRTPLSSILGWTQLLQTPGGAANLSQALTVIERNARAQSKLVEDLLDVSRIATGKLRLALKPISLDAIVAAAADAIRPAAEAKGVVVEVADHSEPDAPLLPLLGDADRLQQVVWNLLSNAVKFTTEGGHVRLAMQRDDDGFVRIRVADTGQGINPAFLPYVFDRFRQADSSSTRAHGGLGIGLTVVRHIVEAHGGTVAAHSDGDGLGATFTVRLPLRDLAAPPVAADHAAPLRLAAEEPALSGLSLLLVEDHDDTRELLAEVLRRAGATVASAGSASSGFARFGEERPDVLVTDIAMPGEDGLSLLRRVRELSPEDGGLVPAIALTAYAREEDRARLLAAGFQRHVTKPVSAEVLLGAIAELAASAAPRAAASTA